MQNNLKKATDFTIRKMNYGWFVSLQGGDQLGPYRDTDIALKVAVTHVLLARKQGFNANVIVRDEHGRAHNCTVIDQMNDPDHCHKCESSWPATGLAVRCPVYDAIRNRPE